MNTINKNHMMYGSWDINCKRQIVLSSWAIFCPFKPLTPQEAKVSQKKTKKKKTKRYQQLTQVYQKHDNMLYYSWDMACDRCNYYFSFWSIVCPFTLITSQKLKIWKNEKKLLEISSFYTSLPKIMIIT